MVRGGCKQPGLKGVVPKVREDTLHLDLGEVGAVVAGVPASGITCWTAVRSSARERKGWGSTPPPSFDSNKLRKASVRETTASGDI